MAMLEIESRHSDYGEDAGGYRVLRFNGERIGRISNYEEADRLLIYVASLEAKNAKLECERDQMLEALRRYEEQVQRLEEERDALEGLVKPKCPDCNSVGLHHCSDPEHCGGVYWPDHMYRKLEAEIAQWKTWGIIEIAVRNPNVASYVEHWEGRATKAEAQVERLTAPVSDEERQARFAWFSDQGDYLATDDAVDNLIAARVEVKP